MQVSSVSDFSDEELYRRMRRGDQSAFSELYDRRAPSLFRYILYSTGNQATAEEVTHEVFLELMAAGENFNEKRGALEPYLYGISRNLIRSRSRHTRRETALVEFSAEDSLDDNLIQEEAAQALHAAVRELPLRYRDAIVHCDIEERSYEETARLMQCPVGTVRSRLSRGRALLAAKMKRFAQVTPWN
jgi:RNA polymerase sigma-70 factor (ECF subfamily)